MRTAAAMRECEVRDESLAEPCAREGGVAEARPGDPPLPLPPDLHFFSSAAAAPLDGDAAAPGGSPSSLSRS